MNGAINNIYEIEQNQEQKNKERFNWKKKRIASLTT